MYPKGYRKYAASQRAIGLKPDEKLARYATRYRLAGQLISIEFAGFSEKVAIIYVAATRISIAGSGLASSRRIPHPRPKTLKLANLSQTFSQASIVTRTLHKNGVST